MADYERVGRFELIDPFSLARDHSNYEFLTGGTGRSIYYRQQRYRVDLLTEIKHLNPRVVSLVLEGPIEDFAITGVSCSCPGRTSLKPREVIHNLFVVLGEDDYYKGRARVSHVTLHEDGASGEEHSVVGLQLLDDVLDIDRIMRLRCAAEIANEIRATDVILSDSRISPQYRQHISDMVFLLVRYRSLMSKYEQELEQVGPMGRADLEAEMLGNAWASLRPALFRLQERLDELTKDRYDDPSFREAHVRYTVSLVSPHLAAEPFSYRAWVKPLGYAGDYQLMCLLYDNLWQGDSLYGKLIHRYPMEHPNGAAVRHRKELLKARIRDHVKNFEGEGPCRILALASGPAREMLEFIADYDGDRAVEFILVDQDNRALGFVNRQVAPLLVKNSKVSVQYLYVALKQLIEDPQLFSTFPDADLLYSAGLFDYLSLRLASLLLCKLYEKLRPGGSVIVGNYASPADYAWLGTYVYDWPLRYRTDKQMLELTSGLPAAPEQVELLQEDGAQQYFLVLTRRTND